MKVNLMKKVETKVDQKRVTQRFCVSVPISFLAEGKEFSGYTRDLSNRGVYFFVSNAHGALIDVEFDCMVELPPEITLSTSCRIQCRAKLLRREKASRSLFGIAAEILEYSILRDAVASA